MSSAVCLMRYFIISVSVRPSFWAAYNALVFTFPAPGLESDSFQSLRFWRMVLGAEVWGEVLLPPVSLQEHSAAEPGTPCLLPAHMHARVQMRHFPVGTREPKREFLRI